MNTLPLRRWSSFLVLKSVCNNVEFSFVGYKDLEPEMVVRASTAMISRARKVINVYQNAFSD